MQIEYVLTKTDLSFDYSDYRTCYEWQYNGFNIDIDVKGVINIESLEPFGDCVEMMENIKSLKDLKRFLTDNFEFIENKKNINELIYLINKNGG
jgi:hypothetical protein